MIGQGKTGTLGRESSGKRKKGLDFLMGREKLVRRRAA
jgi:hypothetical protein